MCTTSAADIANVFIEMGNEQQVLLTNLKLQKLVFFAAGWYNAIFNKPLFFEPIQAWKYGPVVNTLYHGLKKYGECSITEKLDFYNRHITKENDPETYSFLNTVFKKYSRFSPLELVALTHEKDAPWSNAYNGEHNVEIPLDKIGDYFREKLPSGKR